MGILLLPSAPLVAFAAILIGIAHADGGVRRSRLVAYPYAGPVLMFGLAVLMRNRSASGIGGLNDWTHVVLGIIGASGLLLAVWLFVRHRNAGWRWLLLLNSLPLILLTGVMWLWGTFWMWEGP